MKGILLATAPPPAKPTLRRGWCPGALTPMQTGDGWLVRVRPRGGSYALGQLMALAEAARTYGNGEIDLTSRANLQIRGLSPDTIAPAQDMLAAVGLIDEDAAIEAVRNVMVEPCSGLDPRADDVRPLAQALEAEIIADGRLRQLPGKFGFAVDGGGSFPLAPDLADITLRARGGNVEIILAGHTDLAAHVPLGGAAAAAVSLANGFVTAARANPALRRMRDLVAELGAAAIFRLAGLDARRSDLTAAQHPRLPVGVLGPSDTPWAFGVGLPYGRISAPALLELVQAADACGASELRPSPSRILIVPLQGARADAMIGSAQRLGLIVDAGDPRLAMNVCPGAPACGRGTTRTRDAADCLATLFSSRSTPALTVHISGCAKGCAHAGAADLTLVADAGVYSVICHGTVSDTPLVTGVLSEHLADVVSGCVGDHHV